jgi:hypothetical protein
MSTDQSFLVDTPNLLDVISNMMDITLSPPGKIKGLMEDRKVTAADIGRQLNVSRVFVHLTIRGKKKGSRVREALSRELGLPPDFWAEMDRWRKAA